MVTMVIDKINSAYDTVFAELDNWFSVDNNLLNYKPIDGGWTIAQVLEHISITNHYLLILIRKGTAKALKLSLNTVIDDVMLENYDLNWENMELIGQHDSFKWNRPVHMEPTNSISLETIRVLVQQQKCKSLGYLAQLKNGEGLLYKTMMTVNGLGKIDVYHYIFFLVQHAKRHISQMEKIKAELIQKQRRLN